MFRIAASSDRSKKVLPSCAGLGRQVGPLSQSHLEILAVALHYLLSFALPITPRSRGQHVFELGCTYRQVRDVAYNEQTAGLMR